MTKDASEIGKLTDRISKDPKSKLFVPLAEEYKKAGDREMAIHVLTEGLKNNPGYVTARSLLGKLLAEKGDLPGAQKEFEAVTQAIPDNIMAQRKLADIYALQKNAAGALEHYRMVLSLNPNDAEAATCIAELESGREITKDISEQKTAESRKKPDEAAPVPPAAIPEKNALAAKEQHFTDEELVPQIMAAEADEEAEEVLFVEPLDEPASAMTADLGEQIPDFLDEADSFPDEPAASISTEGSPLQNSMQAETPALEEDALFGLGDPLGVQPETSPLNHDADQDAIAAAKDELFQSEEPLFTDGGEIEQEESPISAKAAYEKSDDFTTDTLAELYISQGFFEKAIDIYERMLVDKPTSKGLIDKLAHVRAMEAASLPGDEAPSFAGSALEAGPDSLEQGGAGEELFDSRAFAAPPALPKTGADVWEFPSTQASPGTDQEQPPVARQPDQSNVGFQPREYIPPDAVPRRESPSEDVSITDDAAAAFSWQPASVRRKETVARLENWLKNIIKES